MKENIETLQKQFDEASAQVKSMSASQLASTEFVELNNIRMELFEQITKLRRIDWSQQNVNTQEQV
jgi:hypothetical protein